jgi:hypothetical protein
MDEYLIPNACFKRLYTEYKKYGSLYGAFDFDSTVYPFHDKNQTYDKVKELIRNLVEIGCKVDCWTATDNHDKVHKYLKEENVPYHGINTNGINLPWESRKPFYSFILDDRSGLESMYRDLELLVWIIKKEQNEK